MLASSVRPYTCLVLGTSDAEPRNFANIYQKKIEGLKFVYTSWTRFISQKYDYAFELVVIILTKYTTQEKLDKATRLFKHYATAPVTYIYVNETIVDSLKIDTDLLKMSIDGQATTCETLTEFNSSVASLLSQAKETIKVFEEGEVRP